MALSEKTLSYTSLISLTFLSDSFSFKAVEINLLRENPCCLLTVSIIARRSLGINSNLLSIH